MMYGYNVESLGDLLAGLGLVWPLFVLLTMLPWGIAYGLDRWRRGRAEAGGV